MIKQLNHLFKMSGRAILLIILVFTLSCYNVRVKSKDGHIESIEGTIWEKKGKAGVRAEQALSEEEMQAMAKRLPEIWNTDDPGLVFSLYSPAL